MIRNPFLMLVPMDENLGMAGRLFSVLMVPQEMRSQPEQLRHRSGGQEEKSDGEGLAEQHGAIVAHR